MKNLIPIIIWAILFGAVALVYVNKYHGKKKYKDTMFNEDLNWLTKSLKYYPNDSTKKKYYFHFNNDFLNQGHLLEDEEHNVVCEAKVLYNNGLKLDEVDFVNNIIDYTHHHRIGKVVTSEIAFNNHSITLNSSFKFDDQDIFEYLENKGYSLRFHVKGLAYSIDIENNGLKVGTIYSSNNGKNLYEAANKTIEPKMGDVGHYILETDYNNLDVLFLYALTFARVELSVAMLKR